MLILFWRIVGAGLLVLRSVEMMKDRGGVEGLVLVEELPCSFWSSCGVIVTADGATTGADVDDSNGTSSLVLALLSPSDATATGVDSLISSFLSSWVISTFLSFNWPSLASRKLMVPRSLPLEMQTFGDEGRFVSKYGPRKSNYDRCVGD